MKNLFSTLFLGVLTSALSAQMFSFSTYTETYQQIENGDLALTEAWDDPSYTVPLGFEYTFNGETSSNLYCVDSFVGGMFVLNPTFPVMDILIATTADLIDPGYFEDNYTSPITYTTVGTPGERIFKLQWENAGFYQEVSDGSANNLINLQLWIYEQGPIEVRYGPNTIKEPQIPLSDIFTSGFLFGLDLSGEGENFSSGEILTGPSNDPNYVVFNDFEEVFTYSLTDIPASGRVHRFAPEGTYVIENRENLFKVWPLSTQADINLTSDLNKVVIYEMRDMSGKLVDQGTFNGATRVSMASLTSGIYLVTLRSGNNISTVKVVKY